MPELKIFGVKSKGEKIFIILDSTPWMMYDEIGGIPAYTLIKEELIKILGGLNPTVLFNIAVFDGGKSVVRFPNLVSASDTKVLFPAEYEVRADALILARQLVGGVIVAGDK